MAPIGDFRRNKADTMKERNAEKTASIVSSMPMRRESERPRRSSFSATAKPAGRLNRSLPLRFMPLKEEEDEAEAEESLLFEDRFDVEEEEEEEKKRLNGHHHAIVDDDDVDRDCCCCDGEGDKNGDCGD